MRSSRVVLTANAKVATVLGPTQWNMRAVDVRVLNKVKINSKIPL